MVDWNDEENGESEMEPFEEASETNVSNDEQSNDEEPRIKDVLENLSKTVSREHGSDLITKYGCFQRYFVLDPTWVNTSKYFEKTA